MKIIIIIANLNCLFRNLKGEKIIEKVSFFLDVLHIFVVRKLIVYNIKELSNG